MKKTFLQLTGFTAFLLFSYSIKAQQPEAKAETTIVLGKANEKNTGPLTEPKMPQLQKPLVTGNDKAIQAVAVSQPGQNSGPAKAASAEIKPGSQQGMEIRNRDRDKISTILPPKENKAARPIPKPVIAKPED